MSLFEQLGISLDVETENVTRSMSTSDAVIYKVLNPVKTVNHKLAVVSPNEKVSNSQSVVSHSEALLRQRLISVSDDEYLASVGYVCLNDGKLYKGRDALVIIKHILKHALDTSGKPIPDTYNKPMYVYFKEARVKRENPISVPVVEKNKSTGKYEEKIIYSDSKPDTKNNPSNYVVGGRIESFGFKSSIKASSLERLPSKFYVDKPGKLVDIADRLKSQARKANGELRDIKTPGGYVGLSKKTKSTIKAGGKSPHMVDNTNFNRSNSFNVLNFTSVQLMYNVYTGVIYLLDYYSQKEVMRLGQINSFENGLYQWSYLNNISDELKSALKNKINKLIQPRKTDEKSQLNLPKELLAEALQKKEMQEKVEKKYSPYAKFGITTVKLHDNYHVESRRKFDELVSLLRKDGFDVLFSEDKRTVTVMGKRKRNVLAL